MAMTAISKANRQFRRWEPYISFLITAGVFSLLGRALKVFGQLGWAESIFIGVFAAFLVTAALALYRYWKPLQVVPGGEEQTVPETPGQIDPRQLFVSEIGVDGNKLEEEHRLEIWFRFFNATDRHLMALSIDGAVDCHILKDGSIPEENKLKLPPASLMRDRSPLHDIAPLKETLFVLQQPLSPKIAQRLLTALRDQGFQLYFDDLKITVADLNNRAETADIPIVEGAYLRQREGLYSGRVVRLRVNSTISASG